MQLIDVGLVLEQYLEEISNDPNFSPKEKIQKIQDAEKSLHEYYEINKQYIQSSYTFCADCNEYYLNRAFDIIYKDEVRSVQTYGLTDPEGHRDSTNFQKIKYKVKYQECPKGHLKQIELIEE